MRERISHLGIFGMPRGSSPRARRLYCRTPVTPTFVREFRRSVACVNDVSGKQFRDDSDFFACESDFFRLRESKGFPSLNCDSEMIAIRCTRTTRLRQRDCIRSWVRIIPLNDTGGWLCIPVQTFPHAFCARERAAESSWESWNGEHRGHLERRSCGTSTAFF
jgi:hypothetical protein